MKIRSDFVTNSSSSSFLVSLTITDKKGTAYSFAPVYIDEEGSSDSSFSGDLRRLQLGDFSSVSDLCRVLVNMIHAQTYSNPWEDEECWDEDFDEDEYDEDEYDEDEYDEDEYDFSGSDAEFEASKDAFVESTARAIQSVSDIASIQVKRDYLARGEYADLVADNDQQLCALAKKVLSCKGAARTAALAEMESYIRTPNADRFCESFGDGYEDFRYIWNGDAKALLALAKRLCSGYGPDFVEGEEVQRLNTVNGECEHYAAFKLE